MAGRIPPPNVPIIDEHGFVSNSWYRYLVGTETSTELTSGVLADLATDRLIGRDAAGTGAPEALSVGGGIEFTGAGGIRTTAFTGDVTKAAGGTVLTLAAGGIANGALAVMPMATLKGRDVTGGGTPQDLEAVDVKSILVTVGEALSKTDDTNVTMTLGGAPTTALLSAASMALGWTGTLAITRGGTGSGTAAGAATNLGLGTGDSPQFTAVNIGHATDTTITRTGAGDIAVEGNAIYRAGGTDVALADGGTGASLADPNADRVLFWDDSAAQVTWLTMGTNLTITGTTLDATGGGSGGGNYETLDVDFTDGGNSGTSETDLFTKTLDAGELGVNGDRVEAQWSGTFVSSATATRQLRAYFDGVLLFDTGALTLGASASWEVECTVTRVSSTVVRASTSMTTQNAALAAYTNYVEVTGRTLSNTNILKLTGTAAGVGAATDDIIGKSGYVEKHPITPGAAPDGDYGDITVSGSGAVMTIDPGVVTLAKQANMATASVVYRKTAGSGAPEVQTLATLKADLTNVIETKTFDGTVGTYTFSSIPATFTHLELVFVGRSSQVATTTQLSIRLNGDSGSNYDDQLIFANNATTGAGQNLGNTQWQPTFISAANATANHPGFLNMTIHHYNQTTFYHTTDWAARQQNSTTTATSYTIHGGGIYRSTTAITSLTIFLASGNFVSGSVATLRGVM